MVQPDYNLACAKARTAAANNRKETWTLFSLSYVNALLIGIRKLKYNQPYETIKLMSAVECYAYGIIAQGALAFEDYNLAIGPVASVLAPELFAEEQVWSIEPVTPKNYSRPYRPESYRFRRQRKSGEESMIELVDNLVREAIASTPIAPVARTPSTTDDRAAMEIMLAATRRTGA